MKAELEPAVLICPECRNYFEHAPYSVGGRFVGVGMSCPAPLCENFGKIYEFPTIELTPYTPKVHNNQGGHADEK